MLSPELHGGCAPSEMTLIGVSNQIVHQIRYLRYIRQPPVNFPG